jgi:NAD(P)H-dependent flavin oxidoreductase YrpB (nitropropane dioxygenase family)
MRKTRVCELFGVELPIVSAGMGGVATAALAAAVSEAGGFGTIGLAGFTIEGVRNEIEAARKLTKKPVGVNILVPFIQPGLVEAAVAARPDAITFFWGAPTESITVARRAGIKTIWQCGSVDEAKAAREAGVDAVIAQGVEAGGHVRGTTTTMVLIPQVRNAIGDLPMIAAGGIADGRGLAAALALGADAAVFGTRFIASLECAAHSQYKQRILESNSEDTLYTTLFDVGWPNAPHRVLRTALVRQWEAAGRPESGKRPGEGKVLGTVRRAGVELPMVNYSASPPLADMEGDVSGFAWYAGQSCALTNEILPAGEIVRRIAAEAREVIANRLAKLV